MRRFLARPLRLALLGAALLPLLAVGARPTLVARACACPPEPRDAQIGRIARNVAELGATGAALGGLLGGTLLVLRRRRDRSGP